jgi:redox-sensitive bicupin YhaK (pirin superfamily)
MLQKAYPSLMIHLRKSTDRGDANHGWLKSRHTFSFAEYQDSRFMGFGPLRVINEDRIEGGTGFGTHGHRDMEIISYVVEGALRHQDSMGNQTLIQPGEVQRMSAGTGVRHSEYNERPDRVTHFLQIWILPEREGLAPSYGQKSFADDFADGGLVLVASKSGKQNSITLNRDVDIYIAKTPRAGERTLRTTVDGRLWVQVIRGEVLVEGTMLTAGDGAGIEQVEALRLQWPPDAEFIVFDMPASEGA